MTDESFAEECILESSAAKVLAEKYRPGPNCQEPPANIKGIPYSLLSAEHIREVVVETGLISPFFVSSHRKSRLKKAAYEGRIGSKAFMFDGDSNPIQIFDSSRDESLKVPKNQIVFVECDIDFRLPEFIALRFNLQIKHVHRGLLLGTGPLIDPGYWGKLCIPLHNLTDQDYYLPKNEGLIWIEFTKTTSPSGAAQDPLGRPPLGIHSEGFFEIEDFLKKASKQYFPNSNKRSVPIQSALPTMFKKATESAEKAAASAKTVARVNFWGAIGGVATVTALVVSLVGLMWTYRMDVSNLMRESRSNELTLIESKKIISEHELNQEKLLERIEALEKKLAAEDTQKRKKK